MITDRTANEIILRLTVHEAALIALALDGYGDAIDARASELAKPLLPSCRGLLTSDELDVCAQSAPEPGEPVDSTPCPPDCGCGNGAEEVRS